MLQLARSDYHGLALTEAFPHEIALALAEPLELALRGEAVLAHELVSRFPQGTEITLGLSVSPLPAGPASPEALVITARDLSVSREVSRLQEIALAKEEFFSTVSHELRTPLTSIIAYADMLLSGFPGTEEDRREFVAIMKAEGERLSRLIDEVLDLSRMEANRLTLRLKPIDLGAVLTAAARAVDGLAGQAGLAIAVATPPEPVMVMADPERLSQVAMNLLGNAIKFTPQGGRITIAIEMRERHVEARVSDTGVGIAPEDLGRIFEKFERVDRPGNLVKGTGLGLPITRGLIERMGGRIWAESSPGSGTTVRFTLPHARDDAAGGSTRQGAAARRVA